MDYSTLIKLPQYFRNLHRVSEIMGVFIRHGFGDLVDRINTTYGKTIKLVIPKLSKAEKKTQIFDIATRLRLVCEELGPTFIKLGQLIATRPDVFPSNIISEFKKLQDNVPSFKTELVIKIIEDELHANINDIFKDFSVKPLAAGSIAQVHSARLLDNTDVVIKIRRPNIDKLINTDMDIVKGLISLLEEIYPELHTFNLPLIIDDFHRTLITECDFRKEAQNMLLFQEQHKNKSYLAIPKVYKKYCSKLVITQEFIKGKKLSEITEQPINNKELVKTLAKVLLDSIFLHRFFHADPHPGNIIITETGQLALIDFGEMGRLDRQRLGMLLELLVATLAKNPERMLHIMRENKMTPTIFDEAAVRIQITIILETYLDKNLANLNLASLISEIFEIVRKYGIKPPADILMIAKSITLIEAMAASLDPDFNPISVIKPYLKKRYIKYITDPKIRLSKLKNTLESYKHLSAEFPHDCRVILNKLANGETTFQATIKDLPAIKEHQNRMLNRCLIIALGMFFISLAAIIFYQGSNIIISYFMAILGGLCLFRGWLAIKRNDSL